MVARPSEEEGEERRANSGGRFFAIQPPWMATGQ
jgi:hypothetical protein